MIDRLREVQEVITELRNQLNAEEQQRQRVDLRSVVVAVTI